MASGYIDLPVDGGGGGITALTGEVTAAGSGSVAATVTNSAVIGKVLTGFVSGAGTVAATDTILAAIDKLDGNTAAKFTLPSLTLGSVLFSNGSTIVQDNANFFWDDTNNRLGIGTTAPSVGLDVNGSARVRGLVTTGVVTTDSSGNLSSSANPDSLAAKTTVQAATTANITLSGEQTIDGVLTSNSRILVKDQTTGSENGIYITSSGAWTRSTDADSGAELTGAYTVVRGSGGTSLQEGALFSQTKIVNTVDSDNVQWINSGFVVGGFNEQASNATGLSLVHNAFLAQNRLSAFSADASNPGMMDATTQTLGGAKTFNTSVQTPIGKFGVSDFAATGVVQIPNNTEIGFRNAANSGDHTLYLDGADEFQLTSTLSTGGDLKANTIGKGLFIKTGANSKAGTSVLVGGTVTVSNTTVTSNSIIIITRQASGGVVGFIGVDNIVASTSFDIVSSNVLDTSTVAWVIIELIP